MKPDRQGGKDGGTRDLLLDATEAILVEEGYGAVTSRRVEERAGLKSQLVHYHFGTMDDLFVAVYERMEKEFLRRHLQAVTSPNPLRALWELSIHPKRTRLSQELIALSNRKKSIHKITTRVIEQMYSLNSTFIAKYLEEAGVDQKQYPPAAIYHLITGLSRSLVMDETLEVSTGRDDVLAFAERILSDIEAQHRAAAVSLAS